MDQKKVLGWLNWKACDFSLWVLCALLMIPSGTNAFQYKVGGVRGSWTAPSDPNAAAYNQWAEKNRFQIGDTLLFVYDGGHDSVLHVTKDDYTSCHTAAPIEKFSDGHTVFKLNQSGPLFFISGVADNCHKNEKLVVVVMAARGNHKSDEAVLPAPPSPTLEVPPPPTAPVGGESPPPPPPPGAEVVPPSPAPVGEEPPASPPESTLAPSQESSPPTNSAVSTVVSGATIIIGSTIILVV